MTPVVGEAVPNAETRTMASMIRENRPLCMDIIVLVTMHSRIEVAQRLKRRTTEALQDFIDSLTPFQRAAMQTALRSTVDWEAVISLVLVDPEAN